MRPRRPGRSSCASRPPEPDLDPHARSAHGPIRRSRPPRCRRGGSGVAAAPGRRERAAHPVRPTSARRACRAEPRPLPHPSTRAKRASIRRVGVVRRRIRRGRRAPSAPHAVRAGAPDDRRPAPRPRPPHPCPDAQPGRPGRPRLDPSSRPGPWPSALAPLLDLAAAARQLRPHDRSDPRHPAPLREPRDAPPEVGYAADEVVQLLDGGRGAGQRTEPDAVPPTLGPAAGEMRRPPLAVVGGTPPAHRGRVRGRRRAAAVRGRGVDRPPVSRWGETGGTGLGATTASLRRRGWRARLTRRLRASVRAATPMKRMERLTRRGLPCMATRMSGAGSSGNNDERTAERSRRSGRVIQPLGTSARTPRSAPRPMTAALQVWARLSGPWMSRC